MWGPGGAACIISFICHIPTGMIGINGLNIYKSSQSLGDIYDVIPHGSQFLQGMAFASYGGIVTFVWNFLQFGFAPFCRGYLLALVGVVNLALAIVLTIGVAMEAQFLPGTYGPCDSASDWNSGVDGRNFFVAANATGKFGDASDTNPNTICHSIMTNWVLAIVVIIMYFVCAIINLLFGLLGSHGTETSFGSPPQYDLDFLAFLTIPFLFLLRPFIRLSRLLYGSLYIAVRYVSKYLAWNSPSTPPRIKQPKEVLDYHRMPNLYDDEKGSLNPHKLRLPVELAIMITHHLHSTDLANLARSSHYLRTIFFGPENPSQVAKDLRKFARCGGAQPSANCAVCNIPICQGCYQTTYFPNPATLRHLTTCRPSCTKCLYHAYCNNVQPSPAIAAGQSSGRRFPRRKRRDVEIGRRCGNAGMSAARDVCRDCFVMPPKEREARLEGRCLRQVREKARGGLACFRCGEGVEGRGIRWWVEEGHGRECRWAGHPGWV